jgi:hypothetical protein
MQRLAEDLQLVEVVVDDEGAEADQVLVSKANPLQNRPRPVEGRIHLGCEVTGRRSAEAWRVAGLVVALTVCHICIFSRRFRRSHPQLISHPQR